MNRKRICSGLLAFALAGIWALPANAQQPLRSTASEIIPNQYIVVLNDTNDPKASAEALSRQHGLASMHIYRVALKGFSALIPPLRLEALRKDPRVKSVSADRTIHASADTIPWGIDRIDAEPGAAANDGSDSDGNSVHIAVIDTGIDLQHQDLEANIAGGVTLVTSPGKTTTGGQDDAGHGTHVAGTIAAAINNADVVGVAPQGKLWAVKVLNKRGSGSFSDVIAGIDWVADTTQHPFIAVVNMSLGASCSVCTEDSTDPTLQALHSAIQNAVAQGVTFAVAAGNNSADAKNSVPAAYDEVITVSALTQTDSVASFSNYGEDVDLIAPGVGVLSTQLKGGTAEMSGTSMAAPHVAGAAALVIVSSPGFSPAQVQRQLIETGECADGAVAGTTGCSQTWPGDKDAFAEPLVNAARASGASSTLEPADPAVVVTLTSDKANYVDGQDTTAVLTLAAKDEGGNPISGLTFSSTLNTAVISLSYTETETAGTYQSSLDLTALEAGNYKVETTAMDASRNLSGTGSVSFNIVEPGPTMHVADITMSVDKKKNNAKVTAAVAVFDADGAPVDAATVMGDWTLNNGSPQADSAVTGSDGVAKVRVMVLRPQSGDVVTFTVTNVDKDGAAYDATLNVETADSITIP